MAVTDPTSSPGWAILQHVAHEGPGLVATALERAGLPFVVVRLDLGEPVPEPGSVTGLVAMGGPMGVHDRDAHPWLTAERELMAATVADGKPVLGVCLGAQQLAMALGAEVTTGSAPEIGLGRVELTGPGRKDPVTGPEYGGLASTTIPCVHWHQDTFTIPEGAVQLAASRPFPNQAFRWGERVYGLQFHVEVDRPLAAGWAAFLPDGITLDPRALAEVETVGRRILGRFVQRARTPAEGTSAVTQSRAATGMDGAGR